MLLSDFLKILHNNIGTDCNNQDYIVYICPLIMRKPKTAAEQQDEENDKYYPYSGKEEEKDFLGKIYNGRAALPKEKARMIRKYYDASAFESKLVLLGENARKDMVGELAKHDVHCSVETLPKVCEKLMGAFITAAAMGIRDIDTSKIDVNQEATIPPYDDRELKSKFGAYLLRETRQVCPNYGCMKSLCQSTDNKSAFDYSVVQIDPKFERDNVENLIALCPECARKYLFSLTTDSINRMVDIKLEISNLADADEVLSQQTIVDGVGRVIQQIARIPLEKAEKLNYSPSQIIKKMDRQNPTLYIKIHSLAARYYLDVERLFKDMAIEGIVNYDKFCNQMRYQYLSLAERGGLSPTEIFEKLVNWLHETTHEEKTGCEVVVSYFVQKCEVFDVIAK